MITKEEEKQYYEAMDSYYQEQDRLWNKAKEDLKGLIHPKYFDFAEENETYYSEGIVEVEKVTPTYTNYPSSEHFKIKNGGGAVYIKDTSEIESIHKEESKYEGEEVEYLVWQTTVGCSEDSYTGFLLLPLLDGKRYWKVRYSC